MRVFLPVISKILMIVVLVGMSLTICDLVPVFTLERALLLLDLCASLLVPQLELVHLGFTLGALPLVLKLMDAFFGFSRLLLEKSDSVLGLLGLPL